MPQVCHHCFSNEICVKRVPIFKPLTEAEVEEITQYVHQVRVRAGEAVFRADDLADKLTIIRFGRVKLVRNGPEGEEVLLDILKRGDIYGGDDIFAASRCQETGIALEHTGLCLIENEDIKRTILEKPAIGLKIIEYLNRKLNENRRLLEIISIKDSRRRVAAFLAAQSDHSGCLLNLSQEEIGHSIHLTKETVNRRLAELQKDGLVTVEGRKKIRVLDVAGLQCL